MLSSNFCHCSTTHLQASQAGVQSRLALIQFWGLPNITSGLYLKVLDQWLLSFECKLLLDRWIASAWWFSWGCYWANLEIWFKWVILLLWVLIKESMYQSDTLSHINTCKFIDLVTSWLLCSKKDSNLIDMTAGAFNDVSQLIPFLVPCDFELHFRPHLYIFFVLR